MTGLPVMRQPLQILFLVLVTDLPPAIALGVEPGEAGIMDERPRPKTQPVVEPWMWKGIVVNGLVLSACIMATYVVALDAYAGAFQQEAITGVKGDYRETCNIWARGAMWSYEKYECDFDDGGKYAGFDDSGRRTLGIILSEVSTLQMS